jgi:nucleoside-diphosphate-sugar epimerase
VRLFVTGAFGNIGPHVIDSLVEAGHSVRALRYGADRQTDRIARRWLGKVEIVDGDVRRPETLVAGVSGADVVVHLAFVIPPASIANPELARAVNVDGTRHVIETMRAHAPTARLLFASTLDVFGHTTHLPPPRRVDDPVSATDDYSGHKIACEAMVQKSGQPWGIVRFADVPLIALRKPVPLMFEIPLTQRIEAIHPRDAGLATARAAAHPATWGKIWLIGGGPRCQLTYGEYLRRLFAAMEMGPPLPAAAFSTRPYCTDWLDTDESQRLFQYQRATFEDIVREISALLGWRRPLARLARPLVRRHMLSLSPYWRRTASPGA